MAMRWAVTFLALGTLVGLGTQPASANGSRAWPAVAPVERHFDFPDAGVAALSLALRGQDGRPLYRLECHTWLHEKDPDFDYSGDFECRLTSTYSKERYSTLLTDDPKQSRDWQSRGRFLVPEIVEKCGAYPEYGRIRTFRLRGARLRLELKDVRVHASVENATRGALALRSFGLVVLVHPDPEARSPIAESPNVAPPPPECGPGYRSR